MSVASQDHLLERLQGLGPPKPHVLGPFGKQPTVESLREGQFKVYHQPIKLKPPIDWHQDPHGSRSWRYQFHSLIWLKPLLLAHAESGDRAALAAAVDIVVDWVDAHRERTDGDSEFAWYDMAASQRAPTIAYVLRAGLVEEILDEERAFALLKACNEHGDELADEAKYAADHNHGLSQDEGLYLLARQTPALPAAQAWSELATRRLQKTLAATICVEEGSHLEHSSEYQFAITRMVARLVETMGELPELPGLLERMRRTTVWQVMPNGRLPQLGDTNDAVADRWVAEAGSRLRGLEALPQSGYAFVRDRDSYLALSTGYHGSAHKHADGTGFVLFEGGEVLLGDAGRWGYYEDEPDRIYARSAFAHNVLTVDEQDFDWRESEPYKSGLLAAGEGEGWYAILATNPLYARQGVAQRRLLLYRPGELLVVVDEVRAEEPHDYARRFHLGPGFDARLDDSGQVAIDGERISATLTDLEGDAAVELDRGRDEPTRLGWTYPNDRERLPVWTATLRTHATDATMTAVLSLGGSTPSVTHAALDADRATLETSAGTVEARFRTGERATIQAAPSRLCRSFDREP
jgi:uncharacterized heparinase superfamily protein